MTIYLDYIFIENFLIDYILLKETSYIARRKATNIRAIVSSIIGSVYVVMMIYFKLQELNFLICKLLLIIVMIFIAFKPERISKYIKLVMLFILISVINVGTLTVITNLFNLQNISGLIKIIVYIASLFLSKYFMNYMWKIYKHNIKNDELIYEVKIYLGDKMYKYNAFLDTGNNVFSYTYNVPVIFAEIIDDNILKTLKNKEYFNIRTVTLSSQSNKKAYIFDNIQITQKNKIWHVKSAIVFEETKLSKDNSYNMLLNYNLYEQNLGGIGIWI